MRSILSLLLCSGFLSACGSFITQEKQLRGVASRVVDGDTIILVTRDKAKHRVRLTGIDAPERSQAYGASSAAALRQMIEGKQVTVTSEGLDRYQRVLGKIRIGRITVNEQMVQDGWAWHYKQYSDDEKLAQLERDAQASHRGLWQTPSAIPPWEYRKKAR